MNELEKKAFIFGSIFTLSNKLQVFGDTFDDDITIKQWLFLAGVSKINGPPTISEVANFIGYSRQNAKRIASVLEENGYVIIEKDKDDARASRISLTEKCIGHFAQRNRRETDSLNDLFWGFDDELLNRFCEGLLKLNQNVGKK
jgi:DNA-binding MarR family transcriptional regulator